MLFFKDGFLNSRHELFKTNVPKEANEINLILNNLYNKGFISYPRTTSNQQVSFWLKDSMLSADKCQNNDNFSTNLIRLSEATPNHLGIIPLYGNYDEDEEVLNEKEKKMLCKIYKYYIEVMLDTFKIKNEEFVLVERNRIFFVYDKNNQDYCIDKHFIKNKNKPIQDFTREDLEDYKLLND